jgi:hypothetical protein
MTPSNNYLATSLHYNLIKMGKANCLWHLRGRYKTAFGLGLQLYTWKTDDEVAALYNEQLFKMRFAREFQDSELYRKENVQDMIDYLGHVTQSTPVKHTVDEHGTWSPDLKKPQAYIDKMNRAIVVRRTNPSRAATNRAKSYAGQINSGKISSPDPELIEFHRIVYDPLLSLWRREKPGEYDMPA